MYWKQPDKFEPEHFLDDSGNYITDKEGFIPFGIGMTPSQIVYTYSSQWVKNSCLHLAKFITIYR